MTTPPVWQADRDNWSTTETSEFIPGTGWVTIPENGLSPDCELIDENGRCACGRSA